MLSSLDVMKKVGGTDPDFQEKTLADMRVEADRMARMVTQLLILARTDSNTTVARTPVLLADVLEEACQRSRALEKETPGRGNGRRHGDRHSTRRARPHL